MINNITKDTAQSYTLESIAVFTVLITAIILAQSLYSVEAISQNVSDNKLEIQNANKAESFVTTMQAQGNISKSIRTWDEDNTGYFNTTSETYYTDTVPPTEFGTQIEKIQQQGYNVNVDLIYYIDDTRYTQPYIRNGTPNTQGVTHTTNIPLYTSDSIRDQSGSTETTISESSNFIIQEDSNSTIYNTVTIQFQLWKTS